MWSLWSVRIYCFRKINSAMNRKVVYIMIIAGAAMLLYLLPGQVFGYDSNAKRDPFVPLIGQEKAHHRPNGLEEMTSIEDVILEGIAIGPSGKNVAILNGQMLKENDKVGHLQIRKISKNAVELSIDEKIYTLSLQEDKGIKVGE